MFGDALALIPGADMRYVMAALGVDVVVLLMMGWRWRGLLTTLGVRVDWRSALLINAAGNAVSNLTPARAVGGDAFRVACVRARGASARVATASVIYDRLAELCGFSVLVLLAAPRLSWVTRPVTAGGLALIGVTLVAATPLRRSVTNALSRWHDRLVGTPLTGRSASVAVAWSSLAWLLDVLRVVLVGAAFRTPIPWSLAAALSLARLVSGAVPVPAGIGVVDGALVATLLWGGLPPEVATAVALLERAIVYGWASLLGLLALGWLGGRRLLARAH